MNMSASHLLPAPELLSVFRLPAKLVSIHHFPLVLIRDPVLRGLNRRVIAERGVAATPIAKDFNIIEQIGDRFLWRGIARTGHPFALQVPEEALRGHIVSAVASAARRARRAICGVLALEHMDSPRVARGQTCAFFAADAPRATAARNSKVS